jgi:diguanylate cyclase (GGDEF)-like protein
MSEDPLAVVLEVRRKQVTFKLSVCVGVAALSGPLLGWGVTILWLATYTWLQLLEVAAFAGKRPWFSHTSLPGRAGALGLMALNSAAFGSLSIVEQLRLGPWGATCAAFLLSGAVLNIVLTTFTCGAAFTALLLPFAAYLLIQPMLALGMPHPPRTLMVVALNMAAVVLVLSAIRLWREWSLAKEAEAAAIAHDLAERQNTERHLSRLAHLDSLTGLANRAAIRQRLNEIIAQRAPGALLLVDLDGFKYVNDTLGHSAGDQVLRDLALRLAAVARPCDLIARLGGDEFALLLPGIMELEPAADVGERTIAALSNPVLVEGQLITIGASVGIALYPRHGENAEDLLANADLALYQAKADGRHCSRPYTPQLRAEAHRRLRRDAEFSRALDRGEFELFYQPQVRLSDRAVVAAEALLRWRHPEEGLLTPAAFLPAMEGGRLAALIGDWVVDNACRQASAWRAQGATDFRIAVNLFGRQFRSGDPVRMLLDVLARHGLPPTALEIEITENIILQHEDEIIAPLETLRHLGFGIAFDDYGTGYASLSLLKRYPLTRLKIDQSFIRAIDKSPSDATIVRAVISMARAFNLGVLAEGVETERQADLLLQCDCDETQGYLFGGPMTAQEFTRRFIAPMPALALARDGS